MKIFRFIFRLLVLVSFVLKGYSQNPINAYANVTAISGKTISVSSVNETYHSFENGDYIIIMQMQDDIIGTNTTNAVSFGNIGPIQSAGLFEVARINSHTESGGLPNSIVLSTPLSNTYNINSNASAQLITFRNLGTNFTTTANIGALAWNGATGGVIAAFAGSVFTLAHNISANASGFRGGGKNTSNGSGSCDNATYITTVTTLYAAKGEGNYKATDPSYLRARAKILTGGGGGNTQNSGGGGGGNYTRGGNGGVGSNGAASGCTVTTIGVCGVGAEAMTFSISGSRIFMGGGGGGGHEDNSGGSVGGAGGGILILKANTLATGSCSGLSISADGGSAANAVSDGAGGGGAGGTVFLQVNNFSVASNCQLTVSATGGNGGSSLDVLPDGGGGGGGQGVIIYKSAIPTNTNITNNTTYGTGGTSCYTCTATQNGDDGHSSAGSVMTAGSGPLPVELVSFDADLNEYKEVVLNWITAVEQNSEAFVVQKLNSDNTITELGKVNSKGSYNSYHFTDQKPSYGVNYYRLKQIDNDGSEHLRSWIAINVDEKRVYDVSISPNPVKYRQNAQAKILSTGMSSVDVLIFDVESRLMSEQHFLLKDSDTFEINTSLLQSGVYILKTKSENSFIYKRIIISD